MGQNVNDVPSWDVYFLDICRSVAARSKDLSTQIGCVIVGPGHEIRSTGYNSFPRGINDYIPERQQRPEKYQWMEHAERNAIYNAARCGTQLDGCIIYVELIPCMDCARAIVQCGIREVVVSSARMGTYVPNGVWFADATARTNELFSEASVIFRLVSGPEKKVDKFEIRPHNS